MSRIDAADLRAFPTKAQREFKSHGGRKIPDTPLHKYWTNFERRTPANYIVGPDPKDRDYSFWSFTTNLTDDDLNAMSEENRISFLKKMWEIYRYRKVS